MSSKVASNTFGCIIQQCATARSPEPAKEMDDVHCNDHQVQGLPAGHFFREGADFIWCAKSRVQQVDIATTTMSRVLPVESSEQLA